jgi:hypothetical protein
MWWAYTGGGVIFGGRGLIVGGLRYQYIISKSKMVSFQNSFYIRAANVWNTLPVS